MISVGKKRGPAKRLDTSDFGNRLGRATGSADFVDRSSIYRNEEDDALIIPCCAKLRLRLTYNLNSSAREIDRFEFAFSEEPDLAAICRPERVHCFLGGG